MILGFTGTRTSPTNEQRHQLSLFFFDNNISSLHHGACVGADELSHQAALWFAVPIIVHPPIIDRWMMKPDWDHDIVKVLSCKPYHERNRAIIDSCDRLLALPNGPEHPHSGTWYTVFYATGRVDQHLSKHTVPVTIIWPDGTTEERT